MKVRSFTGMACSIAGALERVGDRWTLLILRDLMIGLRRFDDFRQSTKISPTTLTDRLTQMEAHGLVKKIQYQTNPDRFEYELTPLGRDVWPVLLALANWGDRHDLSERGAPPMRFVDKESGEDVKLMAVSAQSGERVLPLNIEYRAGDGADKAQHDRIALAEERRASS